MIKVGKRLSQTRQHDYRDGGVLLELDCLGPGRQDRRSWGHNFVCEPACAKVSSMGERRGVVEKSGRKCGKMLQDGVNVVGLSWGLAAQSIEKRWLVAKVCWVCT